MCPIEQCHWNSLALVLVMARTSSGKYWFLAIHSKTCHLQVWAQSCPTKKIKCAILEMVQPMSKANVPGCWFYDILKDSMILSLVPDATHKTMSLGQFGFWCGHGQIQFSQILVFSNPCKNISFAGVGPELSQKQTKLAMFKSCSACVEGQCGWMRIFLHS